MSAKRALCHFIKQLPSYFTSGTVATTGAHCCHVSLRPMLMSQSCVHLDGHSYSMKQNVVGSCHSNSLTLHGNTKHVLCLFIKQLPSHFTSSTDTTTEQHCCHVACAVLTPAPRYAMYIYRTDTRHSNGQAMDI